MNKTVKTIIGIILGIIIIVLLAVGIFVGQYYYASHNSKDKKSEEYTEENYNKEKDNDEDNIANEEIKLNEDEKKIFNGEIIIYEAKKEGELCKLDLNRDGEEDSIGVSKLETDENCVQKFDIIVNDSKITFEQENGEYLVAALAFDKDSILLASYTNGVSDDPVSFFYKYDGEKIEEVGYISNDIRMTNKEIDGNTYVEIKGNKLKCWSHEGTLSNYVYRNFEWNGKKLENVDNDEYDYVDQKEEIEVIKEITMYASKYEKDSAATKVKPGIIYPIMAADEGWNYIRTEAGKEGWIHVDDCFDCFGRLNLAG